MKIRKPKPCVICKKFYTPTGNCAKYCSQACKDQVWTRKLLSQRTYDWQVRNGVIKNPGAGTGQIQKKGPANPDFKPNAAHRYRDHRKDKCERCGSCKFLCAHHVDHDHSNNDPNNIETLCKSCHQREHKCHLNFIKTIDNQRNVREFAFGDKHA